MQVVKRSVNNCQHSNGLFTYFGVSQSVTRLQGYGGRCSVEDTIAALEDGVEGAWYEDISCAQLQTFLGTWQL